MQKRKVISDIVDFWLVRHGQTFHNQNSIIQGHDQGTLTSKGIEQSKKVSLRLKDEEFDLVSVSDLKRARETWEIISEAQGNRYTY